MRKIVLILMSLFLISCSSKSAPLGKYNCDTGTDENLVLEIVNASSAKMNFDDIITIDLKLEAEANDIYALSESGSIAFKFKYDKSKDRIIPLEDGAEVGFYCDKIK